MIVCLATAILILSRNEALAGKPVGRALARVGDFSYSLYLVHWPIFAFINNAYVVKPSVEVHVAAVAVAVTLGHLLYWFVEWPARHAELSITLKSVGATVAGSLTLALSPLAISAARTDAVDYIQARRANVGFGMECDFARDFTPKNACRNSNSPTLVVWGDSYAMHIVPGIVATTDAGVVQATQSVCGPFIGLAPVDGKDYNRPWAERCMAFNRSVLDYVAATPSVDTVVLSSRFNQFFDPNDGGRLWISLEEVDGQLREGEPNIDRAFRAMRATAETLRRLGKRVVIVAPPPASDFNIGGCLEKRATGLFIVGANSDCNVPLADYHRKQALVLDFLERVRRELDVPVVSFDGALCSERSCTTTLDGTFVYLDAGNFFYAGSEAVARRIQLGKLLALTAK